MDHRLDTLHHRKEGFCQLCDHKQDLSPYLCFGSLLETKMDRNGLIGVALHGILVVGECGVRNVFHEILGLLSRCFCYSKKLREKSSRKVSCFGSFTSMDVK